MHAGSTPGQRILKQSLSKDNVAKRGRPYDNIKLSIKNIVILLSMSDDISIMSKLCSLAIAMKGHVQRLGWC